MRKENEVLQRRFATTTVERNINIAPQRRTFQSLLSEKSFNRNVQAVRTSFFALDTMDHTQLYSIMPVFVSMPVDGKFFIPCTACTHVVEIEIE